MPSVFVWQKSYTWGKSLEIRHGGRISTVEMSTCYKPALLPTPALEIQRVNIYQHTTSASNKKDVTQTLLQIRSKPFFFFQTRFYIRINSFYPEAELNFITVFWPNLPSGLQAAYEVADRDEVRFFKGNASNYFLVFIN